MSAVEQLITAHREYVRKLAREIHRTLPQHAVFEELVGYGELGLVEAANNYDPNCGAMFTTFAYRRIRGAIFDGIRKMTWLPPAMRRKINQEESFDEFAEDAGSGIDVTTDPEGAAKSFNQAVSQLGAVFLVSGLGDEEKSIDPVDHADPSEAMEMTELQEMVVAALEDLPEEDAAIVQMYYFEGKSMAEIGEALGVDKATISRRHNKVIKSLADFLGEGPV